MQSNHPYLTLTKFGVWHYQRWLPHHLRSSNLRVFKTSLKTHNRFHAQRIGRLISVKIDQLILNDSLTPDAFAESMRLLKLYIQSQANGSDLSAYEEMGLDDGFNFNGFSGSDEWLLNKAINLSQRIQKELDELSDERRFLKSTIEKLAVNQVNISEDDLKNIKDLLSNEVPEADNPKLIDCMNEWVTTGKSESIVRSVSLFCRFMNETKWPEVRLNDIKPKDISQYHNFAKNLPLRTPVKSASIQELVMKTGEPRSKKTLLDEFSAVSSFLNWCQSRGYVFDQRILTVVTKGSDVRVTARDKHTRVPLDNEDLNKLFNNHYRVASNFKTTGMYWAPLIGLFTGARLSEILSLETHNVKESGNTWYFEILEFDPETTDPFKRVKASGSERTVPIHDQLIKLGFLDYVKACKGRLFPDEPRNTKGKFDAFQKRQATLRKKLQIVPPNSSTRKDFHSFRHTFRTRLDELKHRGPVNTHFNDGIIDAIVGHMSRERSVGQKVYTHNEQLDQKAKALNKLRYEFIDWSNIVRWDKTIFAREQHNLK